MEFLESDEVKSFSADGEIQNRSKWLSNNLDEMNRSFEQMLKVIKENGDDLPKSAEIDSRVEYFSRLYQSLVENLFTVHSPLEPRYSDCGSPQRTPEAYSDQKSGFNMSNHQGLDVSFDSGGGSSSLSLKDGTEFSSSSSDSESESFNSSINNSYVVSYSESDNQGLNKKLLKLETELPSIKGTFWMGEEDKGSYDELQDRIVKTEEELKASNLKLQLSENEVARLKRELEKNETVILLSEELQIQLELVEKEKREMEEDLQVEKMRVLELEKQMTQSEIRFVDLVSEIERLVKELETNREMLKSSDDEIAKLTHEIAITNSDHNLKIKELEIAFQVSQEQFHAEKTQLQSDFLRQVEAKKTEMRDLHIAQETALQAEISQLKDEVYSRRECLEALNRDHDQIKLKYDTLEAEKDEAIATIHTLLADKESQKSHVHELEGHLQQLQEEKVGLIVEAESLRKQIDDLESRHSKLKEEVNMQRVMIEDGAEGKREAIRQLCFSLEHYRSGYQELRQAFVGHKQRAVLMA